MQVPFDRSAWGISLIRFGVDDILNTTELIDSQGNMITIASVFFYGWLWFHVFLCAKITRSRISIWSQCKIIRRIIGNLPILGGLDLMSDFSLKKGIQLMVRDITTYNVWNIDEKEYQKIADAYQDKIKNFLKARRSRLQSTIRTF
jgi:hypothetical protein